MLKLGITGGIGSGKTYVARLLQQRGIPLYLCDDEARRLMTTDEDVRAALVALLGANAYLPSGLLNKPYIARYLFADAAHAERINRIVHPAVKRDFQCWCGMRASEPLVALESAILFEAGFRDVVDRVLLVEAPMEVRIQRVKERDGLSDAQVESRIAGQMSDERRRILADEIIDNGGSKELVPQIDTLLLRLHSVRYDV